MKKIYIIFNFILISKCLLLSGQDIEINNLALNSKRMEFGPVLYKDGLVFSRSSYSKKLNDSVTHLDMYYVDDVENVDPNEKIFSKVLTTSFHEGPATFIGDSIIIYTRTTKLKKKTKSDNAELITFNLVSSKKKGNRWREPTLLNISDTSFSNGHPSVSPDGKTLVFSSNRNMEEQGIDIYISRWENNNWSKPQRLGNRINSRADEMFPFISEDGFLYYSSNRGGKNTDLDIYKVELNSKNKPVRLPEPINSPHDDFSFITNSGMTRGFFASNRPGGKGLDDIYLFRENSEIHFTTIDHQTKERIPVKIELYDVNGELIAVENSDSEGNVILNNLTGKRPFTVSVSNATHKPVLTKVGPGVNKLQIKLKKQRVAPTKTPSKSAYFVRTDKDEYTSVKIGNPPIQLITTRASINKNQVVLEPKSSFNKHEIIVIKKIYYTFNSTKISDESKVELDKLVSFLKNNLKLKLLIGAHTDSRGEKPYNVNLSKKRAQNVYNYLVSKNIDPKRLTAKGYGYQNLINTCEKAVLCWEAEHALNRRSEFSFSLK